MTETDWLAATNPAPMLTYLRGRTSERKLRLFACACCRDMGQLLSEPVLNAIEVAELYADGKATAKERIIAHTATIPSASGSRPAYWASSGNMAESIETFCEAVAEDLSLLASAASRASGAPHTAWEDAYNQSEAVSNARQVALLRHIIGNPFRPAVGSVWPATIPPLAEALYAGQDMAFALHDALLEAGFAELAEHFGTAAHPKGCWALDLILGKS